MAEEHDEDREFTEEQMRTALRSVGEEARRIAFAAGQPIVFIKDKAIVALHADGREEILEYLPSEPVSTDKNP